MTRADSMRIMKNLLELEKAKLRMMNGERKSPVKSKGDDYVGLKAMVPKIAGVNRNVHVSTNIYHNTCCTTTAPRRKVSKATKLKDLEQGWINGFTTVDSSLPPPPPPPAQEPEMPPLNPFKIFTTSSSSSQDGRQMRRWSDTASSSPSSRSSSHEGGKQMRRWTDHRNSFQEEDCGNNWTRGKSSAQIELLSRKDMNAKILEAGWISTFKPTQPKLRRNKPETYTGF